MAIDGLRPEDHAIVVTEALRIAEQINRAENLVLLVAHGNMHREL